MMGKSVLGWLLIWGLLSGRPSAAQERLSTPSRPTRMHKLAPQLRLSEPAGSIRALRVQVTDTAAFGQWVRKHWGADLPFTFSPRRANVAILPRVPGHLFDRLLDCPWIAFVDVANRQAVEEMILDRPDWTLNRIINIHQQFPELNGSTLGVSIKERAFDTTDIDFKGRVIASNSFSGPASRHATLIATLIAGGGNSAPVSKGVAWGARLAGADFSELLPDRGAALLEKGISVQNHSYGVAIENYYGLEAGAYDAHCHAYPSLVHVFSAGNQGEEASTFGSYAGINRFANLTGQFKQAKNTLCVGATDELGNVLPSSSRGPSYDGRVKPELVAYADGGTSEAAALVSGISLLMQQAYARQTQGRLPPASLVKAVLINSAGDVGQAGVDFETGYGNADALGAVRTIMEKRFLVDSLKQGEEQIIRLEVPSGSHQVKITLAWHDLAAPLDASSALVNDLDLRLVHVPSGRYYRPWVLSHFPHPDSLVRPAERKEDHLNPVEQVSILNPAPGTYQLQVRGHTVSRGYQSYSIAYEIETGARILFPLGGSSLPATVPTLIRWDWKGEQTSGRLEYRFIGLSEWQSIDTTVNLAQGHYSWIPPDTTGLLQLRLLNLRQPLVSDTFIVSGVPRLTAELDCEEQPLLRWSTLPGATRYQLYRFEGNYLAPFHSTADTLLMLAPGSQANQYYAVAPIVDGWVARRSFTTAQHSWEKRCYAEEFTIRKLTDDSVELQLHLRSPQELTAIHLEKKYAGGYSQLQTISPVSQRQIAFTDRLQHPGLHQYRIRFESEKGKIYFSQSVEVYHTLVAGFHLFPNPVVAGQRVHIAGRQEPEFIRLYDTQGRLLKEWYATQPVTSVAIPDVAPGLYQVYIRMLNGGVECQKLIIR